MLEKFLDKKLQKLGYVRVENFDDETAKQLAVVEKFSEETKLILESYATSTEEALAQLRESLKQTQVSIDKANKTLSERITKEINERYESESALRKSINALQARLDALKEKLNEFRTLAYKSFEEQDKALDAVNRDLQMQINIGSVSPKHAVIREMNGQIKALDKQIEDANKQIAELRTVPDEYSAMKKMNEAYKGKIDKVCSDTVDKIEEIDKAMKDFDDVYHSMLSSVNKRTGGIVSQK